MPKCAKDKDIELTHRFAFDSTPLVDTFSQPLLNTHIPIAYLLTDMNRKINYPGINYVDPIEILPVVGYPRGMDSAHT